MITLDDLHRLPPSPERDRLIRAERDRKLSLPTLFKDGAA